MTLFLVANLSDVKRVGEQFVQCPTRERASAGLVSASCDADFRDHFRAMEMFSQKPHTAEFEVALVIYLTPRRLELVRGPGHGHSSFHLVVFSCRRYQSLRIHRSVGVPLNIRNEAVNQLAKKLATRKHLNKTEAVKVALENELRRIEVAPASSRTTSPPAGSSAGPTGHWARGR